MRKVVFSFFFLLIFIGYIYPQGGSTLIRRAELGDSTTVLRTYVKESIISLNVKDFGAVGDGVTDDITAIQAAVDSCFNTTYDVTELIFPPGEYKISNTIQVGKTGSFVSIHIKGYGGIGTTGMIGSQITADFGDRPALNVQGVRHATVERLHFWGRNYTKITTTIASGHVDDITSYIDTGLTYGRYNPYAAITVDGYSSPQPDSQYYTNHAYDGAGSYFVNLKDINIMGFVAGIAIGISANASVAAMVNIEDCYLENNTYGVVGGGSQNRGNNVFNCAVAGGYEMFNNNSFGTYGAPPFKIVNGDMGNCYRLFNFSTGAEGISITNVYAESIKQIGYFSTTGSSANQTAILTACNFNFSNTVNNAIAVIANSPVEFSACYFSQYTGVFNVVGGTTDISFNNCKFQCQSTWDDIYYIARGSYLSKPLPYFDNCNYLTTYWSSAGLNYNNFYTRTYSLPHRIEFSPTSVYRHSYDSLYVLYNGEPNGAFLSASSAESWNATRDTVSITMSASGEILVDDIIYWQTKYYNTYYQYNIPALKVVSSIGTAVKAVKLFDSTSYDYAYNPTYIYVAPREWTTLENFTGNLTSGNANITGLSDTTIIRPGDFIKGIGIASGTRIVSESGTTAVMSKNATATITGTSLYFGKIKNIRPRLSELSELSSIVNIMESHIPTDTAGLAGGQIYADWNSGFIKYLVPVNLVVNGEFTNWTGSDPDSWTQGVFDPAHCTVEQNPSGNLHYTTDGTLAEQIYQASILTVGTTYQYAFKIDTISGSVNIYIGGTAISYPITEARIYVGEITATTDGTVSITHDAGESGELTMDYIRVWEKGGATVTIATNISLDTLTASLATITDLSVTDSITTQSLTTDTLVVNNNSTLGTATATTLTVGTITSTNGRIQPATGGQIELDSLRNRLAELDTLTFGFGISDAADGSYSTAIFIPDAITVTKAIAVLRTSATSFDTADVNVYFGTSIYSGASTIWTSDKRLADTTSGTSYTSFNTASIPANTWMWIQCNNENDEYGGTVNQINITVFARKD